MKPFAKTLWLLLFCLLLPSHGGWAGEKPAFVVIVHRDNPLEKISADQLSRIFLKKMTQWDDGREISPFDLSPSAEVRNKFSQDILRKTVSVVRAYWQRQVFAGRAVPPPEISEQAEVVSQVSGDPGAIAYVAGDFPLSNQPVKILTVSQD